MAKLSDYIYHEEPAGVIYCGDCLDILPLLPNKSVDLVLTDPPYGSGGRDGSTHLIDPNIIGNRMSLEAFTWFIRTVSKELYRITTDDIHSYISTDWKRFSNVRISIESVGWETRSLIVWNKSNGMGEYWRSCHEFILWTTKRKPRRLLHGSCFNVLNIAPVKKNKKHPTQKPGELILELIKASGGKTILDPFSVPAQRRWPLNSLGVNSSVLIYRKSIARWQLIGFDKRKYLIIQL